jgi:hypothetical protein
MVRCMLCLRSETLDISEDRATVHKECLLDLFAALSDDPKAFAIAIFNSGALAGETSWLHNLHKELTT